ncbi:MAG: hypothetical protein FK734_03085 [Asgard group archaeon]|nr:hypothetical protein [Asgard group archaeon]
MVEAYPRSLPEEVYNKLIIKCMPLGAKDGEFTTTQVEDYVYSGYVFTIPDETSRANIASLAAIFDQNVSNPGEIKKIFAYTIDELRKNNLVNIETLTKILPSLYKGINEGHLKIKISSVVTLEFGFEEENSDNEIEDKLKDIRNEMWSR